MNFPYFIDLKRDFNFKFIQNLIKSKGYKPMMTFLIYNQLISSQISIGELVNEAIFEQKLFPEELFSQLVEFAFEYVESEFLDYKEYVKLQKRYLI